MSTPDGATRSGPPPAHEGTTPNAPLEEDGRQQYPRYPHLGQAPPNVVLPISLEALLQQGTLQDAVFDTGASQSFALVHLNRLRCIR